MTTLHTSTCLLTYSFQLTLICLFIYSLNMLSFACSLMLSHHHAFTHSLMFSHPQMCTRQLNHSLNIPLLVHSFKDILIYSLPLTLSHQLTHSFPIHTLTCPLTVTDLFLKCILTCSIMHFFELTFIAHPLISSNPPSLKDSHLPDKNFFI